MRRLTTLSALTAAAAAVTAMATPAAAAPVKSCNGAMHTNLWNVTDTKDAGGIPGQVASTTAHRDGGLGGVLGSYMPFASNVICKP